MAGQPEGVDGPIFWPLRKKAAGFRPAAERIQVLAQTQNNIRKCAHCSHSFAPKRTTQRFCRRAVCRRARAREAAKRLRAANPEPHRASSRKYAQAHPAQVRESSRKWAAGNRPHLRKYHRTNQRRWRAANLDKARKQAREGARRRRHANPEAYNATQRAYRAANRAKLLKRRRKRYAANPEPARQQSQRRRQRVKAALARLRELDTQVQAKKTRGRRAGMTPGRIGEALHLNQLIQQAGGKRGTLKAAAIKVYPDVSIDLAKDRANQTLSMWRRAGRPTLTEINS